LSFLKYHFHNWGLHFYPWLNISASNITYFGSLVFATTKPFDTIFLHDLCLMMWNINEVCKTIISDTPALARVSLLALGNTLQHKHLSAYLLFHFCQWGALMYTCCQHCFPPCLCSNNTTFLRNCHGIITKGEGSVQMAC